MLENRIAAAMIMESLRSIVPNCGCLTLRVGQRDERATVSVAQNSH